MSYILTIYERTPYSPTQQIPNEVQKYFVVQQGKPARLVDTLEEAHAGLNNPHVVDEQVHMKRGEIESDAGLIKVLHVYPDLYTALIDRYPLRQHRATA